MKSILALLLSIIAFLQYGQTSKLDLSSDVWPPFTDVDSANAIAIDLVREALARSGIQAHNEIVLSGQLMARIQNGVADGSAALWRSAEREKYLLYSEPYLENRLILVGKKGSNVSARSFADLGNKRIAVVGSYAYGLLPGDTKNLTLVEGTSDQENLDLLLSGKADYMLVDALLIEYLMEYQGTETAKYLEIGKNTLLMKPLHFAIRREIPGAEGIIQKFNEEIGKMIAEGVYNKILHLNWITTDVDGDGRTELVLNGDRAGTQAPASGYLVKAKPGLSQQEPQGYFIKGTRYSDWDHVPESYKVPLSSPTPTDKRGAGPVFRF